MSDRRRRRRQNSNDSVVESEDEGVGDDDGDGQPIPRAAGRDYYQLVFESEAGVPDSAAASLVSTDMPPSTPSASADLRAAPILRPGSPSSGGKGEDSEEFESANEDTHDDESESDDDETEDDSDDDAPNVDARDNVNVESENAPLASTFAPQPELGNAPSAIGMRTPLAANLQHNMPSRIEEKPPLLETKNPVPLMTSPVPDPAAKRERGDGMEHPDNESMEPHRGVASPLSGKDLDDDEDRRNPAFIPRRGNFYEHDDRQDDEDGLSQPAAPTSPLQGVRSVAPLDSRPSTKGGVVLSRQSAAAPRGAAQPEMNADLRGGRGLAGGKPGTTGRWYHDMYNEDDQAPKSRQELIAYYGYDPRTRDSPPPIVQVRATKIEGVGRGRGNRRNRPQKFGDYAPQASVGRNVSDYQTTSSNPRNSRDLNSGGRRERGAAGGGGGGGGGRNSNIANNGRAPVGNYRNAPQQLPERRAESSTHPGMGEHLTRFHGSGAGHQTPHQATQEQGRRSSDSRETPQARRLSPQKTPETSQTDNQAKALLQYPPLKSHATPGPASVIPLMSRDAASPPRGAISPDTTPPPAAADASADQCNVSSNSLDGDAAPPPPRPAGAASLKNSGEGGGVRNNSAGGRPGNPMHQQQQEEGEAGLSKGYSMQRRSGRGQTAGTGRARGSASGIGEAASNGDSRSDVQRRLQNLSMSSSADVPAGAAPLWPQHSGGATGGNITGRPLRGAHGQTSEAIGGGRGGSAATSRHAQQPGSGRFAQGPPPKTGNSANEDAAKAALNKRYSSQRVQRDRAEDAKDSTPPPPPPPLHTVSGSAAAAAAKLSPLGQSVPSTTLAPTLRPVVTMVAPPPPSEMMSPSVGAAFAPKSQFVVAPSIHPSVSAAAIPALSAPPSFPTTTPTLPAAPNLIPAAPPSLYPVSTSVSLAVAPTPSAFYTGGAPGSLVASAPAYHATTDLHAAQNAAVAAQNAAVAAHAQNAAVAAAMAQSNPIDPILYPSNPAPPPPPPQPAPIPSDPGSMAAAAAAYMMAFAAAGTNPPSVPQSQAPVAIMPPAPIEIPAMEPVAESATNYIAHSAGSSSEVVHGGTTYYSNPSTQNNIYHATMNQDASLLQGSAPMMASPSARVNALSAKLPLKAIPIVDPNVGGSEPDSPAPPDKPGISFDPSISEFVPQAAMATTLTYSSESSATPPATAASSGASDEVVGELPEVVPAESG